MLADQLLAPVPGGTGRYTWRIGAALAATAPQGWTVRTVVTRCADPSPAAIPGTAGPTVLPWPRRALLAAWERGVPLWPGGDSVHAPTPFAPPRRRGHGLVVTVHDTVPFTHPHTLTRRGARWHRRAITRAARTANALVVPTTAVAAELPQRLAGVTIAVIGHGASADLAEPPAAAEEIAERLRLPDRYVLMLGTVEPRKGIDVLLRALAEPGAPELGAVLVGAPGWGGLDPVRQAAEAGAPAPLVLGAVTDPELATVLHRATVLAVPSLAEGFGLGVLEAMAAGVPVVHSDVPALCEVAAEAGRPVPVDDPPALAEALRAVREQPDVTETKRASGYARAARFTWEDAAQRLWALHLAATGG